MNSRTAAEETTIAIFVFMDIGFILLWKRDYSLSVTANIISALMPVSCSLLRAKTTVGNWGLRAMVFQRRNYRQTLRQKDLPPASSTAVWCYISPASKGGAMRFRLALIIVVTVLL